MLTNSELKSLLKQPGNVCELVFSFGPLATVGAQSLQPGLSVLVL